MSDRESFEGVFMGRLVITERVMAILGKTEAEIRAMGLGEFATLVYNKGYTIDVSCTEAESVDAGRLLITTSEQAQTVQS